MLLGTPSRPGLPYWLVLLLLLGVLGITANHYIDVQQARMLQSVEEQTHGDLRLLRWFVLDALQQQDYQTITPTLQEWGELRSDILEIRLISANGFVVGRYRRGQGTAPGLKLQTEIPYSYKGLATLELRKDLAPLRLDQQRLAWEVKIAAAALGMAFWLLIWTLLRRKREAATQLRHSEEMRQTNARLSEAHGKMGHLQTYLQNILDSMSSVLIGVDAQGRITEWNKGAEAATHIKSEDALGLAFTELMPHLSSQETKVKQVLASGEPERSSRITTVAGGTVRYSDIMVYPVSSGAAQGAVIRVDDVTQQVRFEQMMVQTEKMMSLGGLAAGVAHEINSPLSGVLQNCQNVLRRLSTDLQGNRQIADAVGIDLTLLQDYLQRRKIPEFLGMIREAAERASHIVTDMLAFSRRNPQGFEKTSLEDVVETALRLAASDFEMKKNFDLRRIEFVRDFAPGLPLMHCDRTRIEQVLLNLIKNAAQAMSLANTPFPRRITLRTRKIREWLQIEVEDNGPGMSEEVSTRIFEPFFSTKGAGIGTGLGLSVAYFIVKEQHQGDIRIISAAGQGSRFEVRLPLKHKPQQESVGFSATA